MSKTYTDEMIEFILKKNKKTTWKEFSGIFKDEFGIQKTGETLRKTKDMYEDYDFSETTIVDSLKSTAGAKIRSSKLAKENKALLNELLTQQTLIEELSNVVKNCTFKKHKIVKKKKKKKTTRALFMHLSDLHIRADIQEGEMGGLNKYGPYEEARRLAFFCKEVAEYKMPHRDNTELVIAMNGDLGQGIIHNPESTPVMTTQFAAMLSLFTQAISYLAGEFKSVRIVCTTGNHLRFMHKLNKGRQTAQKWDSFSTIVSVSLKAALKEYKNVSFEIPETPYALIDILGHKFFITHSDTVLTVGRVGKTISTGGIKNKINDLITGLGKIDVVVIGHIHTASYTSLDNGTQLVSNGSMSGIDPFAQSIGILHNDPIQQMFEVTEKHAVGDIRFVRLLEADDMPQLESIIEPFTDNF